MQIKNYLNESEWLPMVGSDALGTALVKNGGFAADMLHFRPNDKTILHTHPGNHILFVANGAGWLKIGGTKYWLNKGDCYFVPGEIPHQVGANENHLFLLSVADDHRPVDSPDRLKGVKDYA